MGAGGSPARTLPAVARTMLGSAAMSGVWLRALSVLAALLSAPSIAAAVQVDVPGSIVVETWEIPNPPVDPDRCVTTFFIQFADVRGAGAYAVVIFNQILQRNQTFTTGPAPNFRDDEYTVSSGQQSITYTAPAGTHRVVVGENSSGQGCQTTPRVDLVSITTEVIPDGRLTASMATDPEEVFVEDEFTATMTVDAEDGTVTNVVPGALVLGGAGRARVLAGPTPPQIGTLPPGTSRTFVWQLAAEAAGVVTVKGSVSGSTRSGSTTTAEARCELGQAAARVGRAAICGTDGGSAVEVQRCRIDMTDVSRPLEVFRISSKGDSTAEPDAGYPKGGT